MEANIVGTPIYAAPEQLRGEPSRPSADLYGVGRVLQEMLLGVEATRADIARLPVGLQRVLRRALREDPATRYQSASEMLRDLADPLEAGSNGCALDVGDVLAPEVTVKRAGEELRPGVFLVHARARSGEPVAALVPRAHMVAWGEFRTAIEAIHSAIRTQHGCIGVRQTADGVPYAEVRADEPERWARSLLGFWHPEPTEAPPKSPPPRPLPRPTAVKSDMTGPVALALGAATMAVLAGAAVAVLAARSGPSAKAAGASTPSAAGHGRTPQSRRSSVAPTARHAGGFGGLLGAFAQHNANAVRSPAPRPTPDRRP